MKFSAILVFTKGILRSEAFRVLWLWIMLFVVNNWFIIFGSRLLLNLNMNMPVVNVLSSDSFSSFILHAGFIVLSLRLVLVIIRIAHFCCRNIGHSVDLGALPHMVLP